MSLANTAFIGFEYDSSDRLPYDRVLAAHVTLRDEISTILHAELDLKEDIWTFTTMATMSYAFNIYKSIGLLIPHHYHESASVLVRQLWEVSLNLHWMEQDPEPRARDFGGFTVMEMRKSMQKTAGSDSVGNFDDITAKFQKRFRFLDRKNKERVHSSFAASNVQQRAEEVGDPWKTDYNLLYHFMSMHTHGAPGAILHQHFTAHSRDPEQKEKNSTALIAYISMKILVANIRLMVRNTMIDSSDSVDKVFASILNQNKEA